jgi:hypothetical protein
MKYVIKKVDREYCLLINGKFENYTGWLLWGAYNTYPYCKEVVQALNDNRISRCIVGVGYIQFKEYWNSYLDHFRNIQLP